MSGPRPVDPAEAMRAPGVPIAAAKFVLTVRYAALAEASLAFLGLAPPRP